jgi:hypothetical protein
MTSTIVVLATAITELGDYCSYSCPLFTRHNGAWCRMVTPHETANDITKISLVLNNKNELYYRHSGCKSSNIHIR